ncbi:Adaptive-response sensory-kinase SasA [Candidatus Magnetaquicoccaceae bacterium FCR-1]|uniref:histidine kinase n=2 Tax=Candidatus Magnetaquiglobus chichijimensis TaxID=3141448 RepID=A0ABQ0C9L6_9PROT
MPTMNLFKWIIHHRIVFGIAILGTALSLLAFDTLRTQLDHHSRLEFQWLSHDRVQAVQRGLEEAIQSVELLGKLMNVHEHAPTDFPELVKPFSEQQRALHDLVWILPQSHQIPMPRDHRSTSPFPAGHDFRADERIHSLMVSAVERRRTVATTIDHAFPDHDNELGGALLVLMPIAGDDPSASNQPIENHHFLLGVFDLEFIVQHAIRLLEPRGVQILILETDDQGRKRFIESYFSRLDTRPHDPVGDYNWRAWLTRQPHLVKQEIVVADRRWTIITTPASRLLSGEEFPRTPWLMLAVGLIITTILVVFLIHVESNLEEKNRLNLELRQSIQKLKILFNQSPDTIMSVDRNGTVLLSNHPDLHHMKELFSPEQTELRDWHAQALRKVHATGEMDHFQYPCSDTQWREVRFVPIRVDGGIAEVMILSSDITEKHAQEEQALRHARLASLGILAAGMAHEINNPNNTIQFNIATLIRAWPDLAAVLRQYRLEHGDFAVGGVPVDQANEMLPRLMESILGNAKRITGIVQNLKHMAKPIPDGRLFKVELHKVIRNVLSIMQHPIRKHTDHFIVELPDDLPDLQGNPLKLEQVFINLVLNALESLPNRSARVTLDGQVSEDRQWITIRVTDEGSGMTDETLANMFTPFFTTKGEQGGLGMGLAIVWEIVQRHKGTIETTSRPGQGTTIQVTLPVNHTRLE